MDIIKDYVAADYSVGWSIINRVDGRVTVKLNEARVFNIIENF